MIERTVPAQQGNASNQRERATEPHEAVRGRRRTARWGTIRMRTRLPREQTVRSSQPCVRDRQTFFSYGEKSHGIQIVSAPINGRTDALIVAYKGARGTLVIRNTKSLPVLPRCIDLAIQNSGLTIPWGCKADGLLALRRIATPKIWSSVIHDPSQFVPVERAREVCFGSPVVQATTTFLPLHQPIDDRTTSTRSCNHGPTVVGRKRNAPDNGAGARSMLRVRPPVIPTTNHSIALQSSIIGSPVKPLCRSQTRWIGSATGPRDFVTQAALRGRRCRSTGSDRYGEVPAAPQIGRQSAQDGFLRVLATMIPSWNLCRPWPVA